MPPPPQTLPDELVEEVLLRFPPENPAWLVRAGLVCRRWCRLVSDAGFGRRFREFHRRPPMLGMLCDVCNNVDSDFDVARLIPTTTAAFPRKDFPGRCVLDARHGRVLGEWGSVLVVWDPITDKVWLLPFPQKKKPDTWTAAGPCDHLDCHQGPFAVVFVCSNRYGNNFAMYVYTYSSDASAWSEPVCAPRNYFAKFRTRTALVGNSLYFRNWTGIIGLKYDLELCQVSLILLPFLRPRTLCNTLLTTTEDGGLGLVQKDDSKLYLWSAKDTYAIEWQRRAIELKTVFPVDVVVDAKLVVIGVGVSIVFMGRGNEVYTVDVKTSKVKKVYEGTTHTVVPFMSFYTPVLRVANTGEGPSAGASTAEQT